MLVVAKQCKLAALMVSNVAMFAALLGAAGYWLLRRIRS
jgi:hypothetical protein